MLNIIAGRAVSGKTEYILNQLAKSVEEGKAAYLIVPRQYTFESDREKLRLLGNEIGAKITVLSFDRIYESLVREYGRPEGDRLNDSGKQLVMIMALRECKDKLRLFKKQIENEKFINNMISFSKNIKRQNQLPEDIMAVTYSMEECTLKAKLYEFALIAQTFDRLVNEHFVNPDDDLNRTAEMLTKYEMFKNADVAFDGFSDFSQAELKVVEQILRSAGNIFVTLCCEDIYNDDPCDKFSESAETARTLMTLAKKHSRDIAKPKILDNKDKFLSEEIALLEKGFLSENAPLYEVPTKDIELYEASDIYDECDRTATIIKQLVREQNYRYSDITVIARDIAEYGNILYYTFRKYGIPVYYDARKPLFLQPFIQTLLSLLRIVCGGFKSDDVFTYLKCGLSPFTFEEIEECEKYVFIWGIDGFNGWKNEWKGNVNGYDGRGNEDEANQLAKLNLFREKLLKHIGDLFFNLKDCKRSVDISKNIFTFIEKSGMKQRLAELYETEKERDIEAAGLIVPVYDKAVELLDLMASVFSDRDITLNEYENYFKMLCKTTALSGIPQSADEVQIGEAGKIRAVSPKAVFVLGANYQSFPLEVSDSELFSLREKDRMVDLGIPQGLTPMQSMSKEYFIAYTALVAPKNRLYISYKSSDSTGAKKSPSIIVTELKTIFQNITESNYNDRSISSIESRDFAVCEFARLSEKDPDSAATLRLALAQDSMTQELLTMREELKTTLSKETARKLYKGDLRLSPSKVETFFHCPFYYFCENGLHVHKVEKATVDARQRGNIIHYLLEMLLKNEGVEKLCQMTAEEHNALIDDYFMQYSDDITAQMKGSHSFNWRMSGIKKDVAEILNFILRELSQSKFKPVGFEVAISKKGDIQPAEFRLSDGSKLFVTGKIDRVDVGEINGSKYLRVIDYKTGEMKFTVEDVFYGLNMQMLIYLFAATENGTEEMKNTIPAGILYFTTKTDHQKYDSESQKKSSMKMNGIILDSPSIILGMDSTGDKTYINHKLKKDGTPDAYSLVTSQDGFEIIREKVYEKIIEMGNRIKEGEISVAPLDAIKRTACQYCKLENICRIQNGKEIPKVVSKNNWVKAELEAKEETADV